MAEVLSQNQIDQLLNSFQSGDLNVDEVESSEKKVRPYDFKIPKKFNKEQIKTLSIIYENYGRILSSYLSGTLRSYCQIEVVTIEEQRYFEYSNALPESMLMGILEMHPLAGTAMITMSQSIAFAIIDRLLGGQGDSYEVDRDYTDIELSLIEKVIRQMGVMLKDAWSNVYELSPEFMRLESNSRQSQLVSPNETVVIIMLNVKIKEVEGNISFCMPYIILEPVLEHLNTRYWFTERMAPEENIIQNHNSLMKSMNKIPIEFRAILGSSHLTLHEVMDLQVGDVITLDQNINDKTKVLSNKSEWFLGTLGKYKNHRAIRVDEVLLEGVIDDDF
jgi:flagellar motor switch protein FliM